METVNNPIVTEWLSLDQLRVLLTKGELEIKSPGGTLRLYVNFCDRVSAEELTTAIEERDQLRRVLKESSEA